MKSVGYNVARTGRRSTASLFIRRRIKLMSRFMVGWSCFLFNEAHTKTVCRVAHRTPTVTAALTC